jgi:hypothetical protein
MKFIFINFDNKNNIIYCQQKHESILFLKLILKGKFKFTL